MSQQVLDLLLLKQKADPDGLRAYLPELLPLLEQGRATSGIRSRNPFGLTEHERTSRIEALTGVRDTLKSGAISREEAIKGLESCATLIEDGSLPTDFRREEVLDMLKTALGKSLSSFKAATTVPVESMKDARIVHQVAVLRGATLNLTWDMRLISVTIKPNRYRERARALRIVGIAEDRPDAATRHDEYLAEAVIDAAS